VEHAYPLPRDYSWHRRSPRPARLLVIVLVALGGWILIHRVGAPAAAQSHQVRVQPRSATSVLVLNGNGRSGVAGTLANTLLAHGYLSTYATDAPVTTYARSIILYRRGWAGAAERLATDTKIRAVAPLDGKLPAGSAGYPLVAIVGR
jgi:hypothetical protein